MAEATIRRILGSRHELRNVDSDVLDYLSSSTLDAIANGSELDAVCELAGPILQSCSTGWNDASIRTLCTALVAAAADGKAKAGTNAAGDEDAPTLLSAPVRLGATKVDNTMLDYL